VRSSGLHVYSLYIILTAQLKTA